jgi:RHS repeat-associated protein
MDWDFKDQLHATRQQVTNTGRGETTYYVYDSAGQRVRKVTERTSGSRKDERIYLTSFEIYRKYDSVGTPTLERETLHVMDDKRRIAMLETKTINDAAPVEKPTSLLRLQLGNHLRTSALEIDDATSIISYEEYYPFGSTSYQAVDHSIKAARKRYRYTGKERDDETGLYYHGARYYSPWLGRWASCDPSGIDGGLDLYVYVDNRPAVLHDPNGKEGFFSNLGESIRESPLARGAVGFTFGVVQAFTPGAGGLQSPPNGGEAFEVGKGFGQVAGGVVEMFGGGAAVGAGLASEGTGGAAIGVAAVGEAGTAGVATPVAIPVAAAGAGAIVLGATLATSGATVTALGTYNVAQGLGTIQHAMSSSSGGESGGAPKPQEPPKPAPEPAPATPPSEPPAAPTAAPAEPSPAPKPKGSNNPATQGAAKTGQEAHRQIEADYAKKGYETEKTFTLKGGKIVRKDAALGKETVIIKPDTPTGRAAGVKRADLMKENAYDPKVHLYDPKDPKYQPGSQTYMGPKAK